MLFKSVKHFVKVKFNQIGFSTVTSCNTRTIDSLFYASTCVFSSFKNSTKHKIAITEHFSTILYTEITCNCLKILNPNFTWIHVLIPHLL